MVEGGLKASLVCLDPGRLPRHFAGRSYDTKLLQDLPEGVDPCAENGEFHTFAWDGPMFSEPVSFRTGETVERDGFVFTDLLPA
jgi:diphthamide synthase (EF-2-diphthine--ammonia ligase)